MALTVACAGTGGGRGRTKTDRRLMVGLIMLLQSLELRSLTGTYFPALMLQAETRDWPGSEGG